MGEFKAPPLRIGLMTLGAPKHQKAIAGRVVYTPDDGSLSFENVQYVEMNYSAIKTCATHFLSPLAAKDFVLYVDGPDIEFARLACAKYVTFSQKSESLIDSVLARTFMKYQQMVALSQIDFPEIDGGNFQIPPNIVNISMSPDGTERFTFDHEALRAEHLYVLMAVYAVMQGYGDAQKVRILRDACEAQLSPKKPDGVIGKVVTGIKQMVKGKAKTPATNDAAVKQILDAPVIQQSDMPYMSRAMNAEFLLNQKCEQRSDAGKRISDNEWIL